MVRDVIDARSNGIAGASTQRLAPTPASILRAEVFRWCLLANCAIERLRGPMGIGSRCSLRTSCGCETPQRTRPRLYVNLNCGVMQAVSSTPLSTSLPRARLPSVNWMGQTGAV